MGILRRALGLMSGTSMDGIDVAMVTTDGETIAKRGPAMSFPYPDDTRMRLRDGLVAAREMRSRFERPGNLATLETELTELNAAAVSAFRRKHGIGRAEVDVVGYHGQTVLHRPPLTEITTTPEGIPFDVRVPGFTVQLGDGKLLAELTALPVVYDLRAADMDAGGHGAPLVPVYHRALASSLPDRPLAILNIGGIANVTYIGRDGTLLAFDTGPGNALIDDWMLKHTGQTMDEGGQMAARGRVNEDVVRFYLAHSYFTALPPKSLDRSAFIPDTVEWMSVEDGAATLTALTAGAIARSREHMKEEPAMWIVAGGGRRNAILMRMIAGHVEGAVVPAEAAGLAGDSLEAEAWAFLAVRSLDRLPITFPGTTGIGAPATGGVLVPAPVAAV
ncbi:MAG: anhydro-N-acetylmuramic acid kinase [Hyphomicrobiaceae bacterium]|nr:anhydro-N-acetylmuramic acid kinase [Hyphomicrobiaceae bacterium]